jgi:hypothetical protein
MKQHKVDIQRVDSREALQARVRKALKAGEPVRRDPYWKELSKGRYLGYRFFTADSLGTWLCRYYDGEKYVYKSLGDFKDTPEGARYDAAKAEAEKEFARLAAGGAPKSGTIRTACEAYVEHQRMNKSEAAALDAEARFKRLVYDDPLGRVQLAKLKPTHFAEWKKRVLDKAKENGDRNPRGSFNRNAVALRAALNLAHLNRQVTSDVSWKKDLRAFTRDEKGKDVARRRTLYLSPDDRRRLVENASDEAKPLLQAMNMLPVRPGDLPSAKVEDLDVQHRALRLSGKNHERVIPLGNAAFEHLKACAKGKLPSAWLIARADGSQWRKESWRDEIKLAAAGAKLPRATVAYSLRHSLITDMVKGGLDLFHVAKISGTSVSMIERVYGHLQADHARAALEKLAALA